MLSIIFGLPFLITVIHKLQNFLIFAETDLCYNGSFLRMAIYGCFIFHAHFLVWARSRQIFIKVPMVNTLSFVSHKVPVTATGFCQGSSEAALKHHK